MIVMGRIVAPYGVYGWLKVQPETEALDGLLDYPAWWLGREEGMKKAPWQRFIVESAKVHVDTLLVKLQGISDRTGALAFKGQHIAIPREELPQLNDDEFYHADLIGLAVINQQQMDFGKVIDVIRTGANDVLVVKQGDRERLIPFIDQAVLEIDLDKKLITVDWDPGF